MKIGLYLKNAVKLVILLIFIRPFIWYFLGLNRYSRLKVPLQGPLILAPNHNSHLDTVLVFGLLPLSVALRTSAVAAGDYFCGIPIFSWFLFKVCDMVPIWRRAKQPNPLAPLGEVLKEGRALLIFPEGTRGLPEQRVELKRGVARLAMLFPEVPVVPIYLRGLGKSLPRGEMIFVPLIPQVVVGEPLTGSGRTEDGMMQELALAFEALEQRISKKDWVLT